MLQSPHVRLLVSDLPASFRFYQETLGMTPRFNLDDVYAEFDMAGQTLALYRRPLMAEAVGSAAKPVSADMQDAAMLVLATDDVDFAASTLQARGVTLTADPTDRPLWGIRTAHFRDPDGYLIEINCPLPA